MTEELEQKAKEYAHKSMAYCEDYDFDYKVAEEKIKQAYITGYTDAQNTITQCNRMALKSKATKELQQRLDFARGEVLRLNKYIEELQEQNTNLQTMLQAEREVRCNDEYLKKVTELEAQIEKMKCCANCIYRGECELSGYKECKNFDKWELAE